MKYSVHAPRAFCIGFIVAFALSPTRLCGQEPPPNLLRRVAARETESEKVRNNYTWRQSVTVQELDSHGAETGHYREVRDILFSPDGKRIEQVVDQPVVTMRKLRLTEEDYRDLREIQPLMLTTEAVFMYEAKPRGDETIDGVDCWVLEIRPRQILSGQRLFEGMLWVDKSDNSIVKSDGRAVPQEHGGKHENLFPHFTTTRKKVDGQYWFPSVTFGDDQLPFSGGVQRMRLTVRYSNYKRFSSDSNIIFDPAK